jgi:hypothetical protein
MAPHEYGAHELVAPAMHRPDPSQVEAARRVPLLQSPLAQVVPAAYRLHCPWPLHVPFVPQLEAGCTAHSPRAATAFAGTSVHVPRVPGSAQERHVPSHVVEQHAPSTQKPLKHSLAAPQAAPLARRPVQAWFWHVSPGAQSASPLHVVSQPLPPQR